MNSKHTPGSWRLTNAHPKSGMTHCLYTGTQTTPFASLKLSNVDDANVITAAPDLLAALEQLVKEMGQIAPAAFDEFSDKSKTMALTAIAKAKGDVR